MSPTTSSMESGKVNGKGKRIPDQPLHMTTRRAAKNRHSDGITPSFNGSTEDDNSRRGSFDDLRAIASSSDHSQVSATQTLQLPGDVNVTRSNSGESYGPQVSAESISDIFLARPIASKIPLKSRMTSSRKRKRQSQSSTEDPAGLIPSVAISFTKVDPTQDDAVELAETNGINQLSPRERSPDSSQSDDGVQGRENLVTATLSADITPTPSAAASPASSISGSDSNLPIQSRQPTIDGHRGDTETQQKVDELDDVDVDEEEDQVMQGQSSSNVRRRIGGRRRAPHADPRVEAAMRRQAHLKTAFRHLGKALKPLLDEIASRTLDDLQHERSHTDAVEFNQVQQALDDALAQRKRFLYAQNDLDLQLWKEALEREQSLRRSTARQLFEEGKDLALTDLEREIAAIERTMRVASDTTGYATEDEDGVVPRTKHASYRYKRGQALDTKYESRSRNILYTKSVVADVQLRFKLGSMLRDYGYIESKDSNDVFTTMDSTPRESVLARHEAISRIDILAKAAERVEHLATIPVIKNEDAVGLNVLGDLATRPSISFARPVKHYPQLIPSIPPPHNFVAPIGPHSGPRSPPRLLSPGLPRMPIESIDRSAPPSLATRHIGAPPAGSRHYMFSPEYRAPEHHALPDLRPPIALSAFASRPEPSASTFGNFRSYNPEPDWQEQQSRAERDHQNRPPASFRPWLPEPLVLHHISDRRGEELDKRMPSTTPNAMMDLSRTHDGMGNGRFREYRPTERIEERPSSHIPGQQFPPNHHHPAYNTFGEEHMYMRASSNHQGSPLSHAKLPHDPARSPRSRHSASSHSVDWRDRPGSTESGSQNTGFGKLSKADRIGQPRRKRTNQNRERSKTLLAEPQSTPPSGLASDPSAPRPIERYHSLQQQWQIQDEAQSASRPAQSPAMAYAMPASFGPAPPSNYFRPLLNENSQPYDRNPPPHHRASLPGLHPSSSLWPSNKPPASPLFAVPQEQIAPVSGLTSSHQPLPPGVHPDSYRTQLPPAPPPLLRPGPPPPASASGTGYGGPAIAPARYDHRFQFPGSFAPPPAFAQQEEHQRQQHRNSNEANRRRTHSDSQRPMKVIHHRPGKN